MLQSIRSALAAVSATGIGALDKVASDVMPGNLRFAPRRARQPALRPAPWPRPQPGDAQPAGHKHVNVVRPHADGGFGRGLANAITRRQLAALQKAGKHVEGSYIGKGATRRLWGTPLPTWLPTSKA